MTTGGVFDTTCRYSHTLSDDPLVHPKMPGMSHVHDFFGNRTTAAGSTGLGLLNAARGNPDKTTCKDKLDGSGYWAPALYQDGAKVRPRQVHVYYRHRGNVAAKPFPVGFGMITQKYAWSCGPGTMKLRDGTVPTCSNGRIILNMRFPACWDGVRLFAQDGSHVSFPMRMGCDARHPVRIPQLSLVLSYRIDSKPHTSVLASGAPTTAHADFFNAWEPQRLAHLVEKCLNHGRVAACKLDNER